MDAVITAGGIPQPDDPLYSLTQGENKAMLDVAGKPMIQWVLDAISGSDFIDNIVIVGLENTDHLVSTKPLHLLPSSGRILDNIKAGVDKVVDLNPETELLLVASSDIPAITTEMVDWVIQQALHHDVDVFYNAVERQTMETRFPNARRSYIKLKGAEICGGDINAIKVSAVAHNDEIWDKLETSRKNALKQASILGFDTLLLILLRLIDINGIARTAAKRIGLTGHGAISPFAEIAMDVDKPHQLEILRQDLANKQ